MFIKTAIRKLFPKLYMKMIFFKYHGYKFNTKNPSSFSEKLMYRKMHWSDQRYVELSDKVKVKEYVADLIGEEYVNKNIAVYENITVKELKSKIDSFGDMFIKANHNSGPVFGIGEHTTDRELEIIVDSINKQMNIDFGSINQERWYSKIERKILLEKKLVDKNNNDILDYKFHVFRNKGKVKTFVQVDFERNTHHSRSFYDENFRWIPFTTEYPIVKTDIAKPRNFDEMLKLARQLSLDFDYVRVDFYNIDGEIIFGEITFAHGSGLEKFNHREYDFWLGKYWVY
ncbi:ATP-grasp fold amidoligase family protein [Vibrio ezurae]|nr:ATP-grasp fold amidoligase family protein [Vibrio ezurae]